MPAGRPTDYDPIVHPAMAEGLARSGSTNTEIADGLGISRATFHNWQKEHSEFLDSIKRGKETPDDDVEKSLYKRALGYDVEETKAVVVGTGEYAHIEYVTQTRHIPSDPTSCIFWLKNRRPKEWRDKQEVEHSGTISWVDLVKDATTTE